MIDLDHVCADIAATFGAPESLEDLSYGLIFERYHAGIYRDVVTDLARTGDLIDLTDDLQGDEVAMTLKVLLDRHTEAIVYLSLVGRYARVSARGYWFDRSYMTRRQLAWRATTRRVLDVLDRHHFILCDHNDLSIMLDFVGCQHALLDILFTTYAGLPEDHSESGD